MRFNFVDGVQVTLIRDFGSCFAVALDYTNKRVYWISGPIAQGNRNISSCDYEGGDKKAITSGNIDRYLLGVFRDSLFFIVNISKPYHIINQMNISNGSISRNILVKKSYYYDLIVVDSSIPGELNNNHFLNVQHNYHNAFF